MARGQPPNPQVIENKSVAPASKFGTGRFSSLPKTYPNVGRFAAVQKPAIAAGAALPVIAALPQATTDTVPAVSAALPRINPVESGIIPSAPPEVVATIPQQPSALQAIPAITPVANVTDQINPNAGTQPATVSALDTTFAKQVNAVSPFTDQFGQVRKGSFDDLFNSKFTGARAKDINTANIGAFEAGTARINAAAGVKQVNDAAAINNAANATRIAAENAQNATMIATTAAGIKSTEGSKAAEIASQEKLAKLSSESLSKQAQVHPVGQHLEGPPGLQVPVTDYGLITNGPNGVEIKPIAGANSASVANNVPPPGHVAALKQNPALKADFDAKYGAGAADAVLGTNG